MLGSIFTQSDAGLGRFAGVFTFRRQQWAFDVTTIVLGGSSDDGHSCPTTVARTSHSLTPVGRHAHAVHTLARRLVLRRLDETRHSCILIVRGGSLGGRSV